MPRRRLVTLLAATLAVAAAAALIAWRLASMTPAWWSPPAPDEPGATALAERVEYGLAEQAHLLRPDDGTWRLRVTEQQVNAWLAVRLPQWLAHAHGLDWPRDVSLPQVRIEPGTLRVACRAGGPDRGRYLSAILRHPAIDDRGLAVDLAGVSIGRLWIPGGSPATIAARLEAAAPAGFLQEPAVAELLAVLAGRERLEPILELHDGRRVRLTGITYGRGELVLRCRTLREPGGE